MKSLVEIETRLEELEAQVIQHEEWVRDVLEKQKKDRAFYGKDCIIDDGELRLAQEAVKETLVAVDLLKWVIS